MTAESQSHGSKADFMTWTTKSGRPLAELNAIRETIVEAMDQGHLMRELLSEQNDSRQDKFANKDALEDMRKRFPMLLKFLSGVNVRYFGQEIPEETTVQDAINLAQIGVSMAGYLIDKSPDPLSYRETVPDIIGDSFKVNAGLIVAFAYFQINQEDEEGQQVPLTGKNVYNLMNDHDMLMDERACPAPPSMIMRTVDALVHRQGAEPDTAAVDTLFPDFEDLKSYSFSARGLRFLTIPVGRE